MKFIKKDTVSQLIDLVELLDSGSLDLISVLLERLDDVYKFLLLLRVHEHEGDVEARGFAKSNQELGGVDLAVTVSDAIIVEDFDDGCKQFC